MGHNNPSTRKTWTDLGATEWLADRITDALRKGLLAESDARAEIATEVILNDRRPLTVDLANRLWSRLTHPTYRQAATG